MALGLTTALALGSPAVAAPEDRPAPTASPTTEPTPPPKPFTVPDTVQAAVDALLAAQSDARTLAVDEQTAWQAAAEMWPAVVVANGVAEAKQAELETFARNAYMYGSPTTSQLILNSADDDIADTIHGTGYIQSISRDKGVATALALEDAERVQIEYADLLSAAYAASLDTLTARQRVTTEAENLQRLAAQSGTETLRAVTAIASIDDSGCPTAIPADAIVGLPANLDVNAICKEAITQAQTAQAKAAVQWAFTRLGSPYACEGVGRMNEFQMDCSSLVSRAYEEGAGIVTSVNGWAPTTHTMIPGTHPNVRPIKDAELSAGDLSLYYTCPEGEVCTYNHVVMYLGEIDGVPLQLHTNSCGGVANLTPFWGTEDGEHGGYLGSRKVVPTDPDWVAPAVSTVTTANAGTPLFG